MSETGPSLQRPATRAARLSAIEQALATHIITSQSQLSKILIDEGIAVTQATLSRDLDEMHAVKTRLKDGTVAYTVGRSVVASEGEDVGERGEAQMSRVLTGHLGGCRRKSGCGAHAFRCRTIRGLGD